MITILKHFESPDPMGRLVGGNARVVSRVCSDEPTLVEAVREGYELLLADGSVPLGPSVFQAGSRLRRVICFDVGPLDWVDLDAATQCGVTIALPRTRSQNAVAEHTLALILALQRHLDLALEVGRIGGWPERSLEKLRGGELRGKTLGIVGWSRIGKLVAEKAFALGMRILVNSSHSVSNDVHSPLLGLEELLQESDIVSLHARLTAANHHLLGERQLRLMKPTGYLVNTARGALIDEVVLERALREGWIAGAALDVLENEPPTAEHPLLQLPNVLVTPHVAWNTAEVRSLEVEDLQEEIRRAVAGEAPLNCANPSVLQSEGR